jgi:hypothetical protein
VSKAGTKRRLGLDTITPKLSAQINTRNHKGTVDNKPNGITIMRIVSAATIA